MYLRQLDNLTSGKDGGTGGGGVLMTQESMTDADAAKVYANTKSDAHETSDASKIDTPKINEKRRIEKPKAVSIVLSW